MPIQPFYYPVLTSCSLPSLILEFFSLPCKSVLSRWSKMPHVSWYFCQTGKHAPTASKGIHLRCNLFTVDTMVSQNPSEVTMYRMWCWQMLTNWYKLCNNVWISGNHLNYSWNDSWKWTQMRYPSRVTSVQQALNTSILCHFTLKTSHNLTREATTFQYMMGNLSRSYHSYPSLLYDFWYWLKWK